MNWLDISISVFLSFVLNGLGLLFVRSIIDTARDRDMANIKLLYDKNLAEFNAGIKKIEMIQSTRFTDLHKRRAEVMAELYRLLAQAERLLRSAQVPTPIISPRKLTKEEILEIREEEIGRIYRITSAIFDFYEENKIFLMPHQMGLIDGIIEIFKSLSYSLARSKRELVPESEEDEEIVREMKENDKRRLREASEKFANAYPNIKADLESSFRDILGFGIEQASGIS